MSLNAVGAGVAAGAGAARCWEALVDMTMVVAGDAVAVVAAVAATIRAALAYSAAAMPDSRYNSLLDNLSGCLGCRRQRLACCCIVIDSPACLDCLAKAEARLLVLEVG